MRIIGGRCAGRRFAPATGFRGRPTTDRAKEALFNILTNRLDFNGLQAVDLFSGTGSIALELASRGANVLAVEKEIKAARAIQQNAKQLGLDNLTVQAGSVERFLAAGVGCYDFIFADPPYFLKWLPELPNRIAQAALLKPSGLLVLEHRAESPLAIAPGEIRVYGDSAFAFYDGQQLTEP